MKSTIIEEVEYKLTPIKKENKTMGHRTKRILRVGRKVHQTY